MFDINYWKSCHTEIYYLASLTAAAGVSQDHSMVFDAMHSLRAKLLTQLMQLMPLMLLMPLMQVMQLMQKLAKSRLLQLRLRAFSSYDNS